jgi:GTP-binding protein
MVRGRRIKLKYITQARTRPPSFMISANMAEDLPDDYRRYLINGLRDDFGLAGVPIRIKVRGAKNPFAERTS